MSPLLLTGDGKHFEAIQRRGEVERESRAGGNPRNPLRFFFRLENITTTNNSKKQQLRLHNSVTKRINEVFLVFIFNPKISIQRKRTGFNGGAEDIFGKRSPLCESTLWHLKFSAKFMQPFGTPKQLLPNKYIQPASTAPWTLPVKKQNQWIVWIVFYRLVLLGNLGITFDFLGVGTNIWPKKSSKWLSRQKETIGREHMIKKIQTCLLFLYNVPLEP